MSCEYSSWWVRRVCCEPSAAMVNSCVEGDVESRDVRTMQRTAQSEPKECERSEPTLNRLPAATRCYAVIGYSPDVTGARGGMGQRRSARRHRPTPAP